jgi:uncharacterized protein YfdQ (DUF2303 family)
MDTTNISNIQAALDAGRALGTPIEPPSRTAVVVVPEKYRVEDVEKYIEKHLPDPRRTKTFVSLANADSFIAYVLEYKTKATKVFASVPPGNREPSFLAVLDYHEPGLPHWGEHRAGYTCAFTPEWQRWMNKNAVRMTQVELATFLEENATLVLDPPGAELLELVSTLEGKNNISCSSMVRLPNGKQKLTYEEDVELRGSTSTTQGQVEFPSRLVAGIEPFSGGPTYKITCRLKYRIENRKITFWFECIDVHLVIKECVQAIVDLVQEKLAIVPLNGHPGS